MKIATSSVVYERTIERVIATVLGWLLGAGIFILGAAFGGPIGALLAIAGGITTGIWFARRFSQRRAENQEISIENGELRVPSLDLVVKKANIRGGIDSATERAVVLDLDHGSSLSLKLANAGQDGERILHELGVAAAQRTTRVPLRRMLGRFSIGLLTFLGSIFGVGFLIPMLHRLTGIHASPGAIVGVVIALATLLTVAVVMKFGSPHVVIGSDGIRTRGLLGETFLPYADIVLVEHAPTNTGSGHLTYIKIHRRSGGLLVLPLIAVGAERVKGLLERIDRARKLGGDAPVRLTDALARAGKPLDKWREELAQLANRQGNFREAAFQKEEIESVLADPKADAAQRIGAAFVLYRIDPEIGKEKVRIAADATAEDDLREALLAAVEGEMESDAVKRSSRGR